MGNIYKRCEAWATALRSDLFRWARVKLTVLYLIATVIILAVFSVVLYANLAQHLHRDFGAQRATMVSGSEENVAEDALERTEASLILADAAVLLVAGAFSYWLAGYTLKPIRKALDAQISFSAEASHELRTPLAVMRTGIEVLLRSHESVHSEAREVLENNLEEIASMSAMVEQLLALSRGQSVEPEAFSRLNLTALVRSVTEKLSKLAAKKGVELSFEGTIDFFVNGRPGDLERVLQNVIGNAVAYTPGRGSVTVSIVSQRGFVEVSVADTGVGIAPKDIPYIFEPFYKTDQARAVVGSQVGAGLGLAIVKQIVEQHHGSVEVASALGKGTTVTVHIPKA